MFNHISFLRIVKTALQNFWRNFLLSATSSVVMTITLIIFTIMFLMFAITSYSIKTVQNKVDISVYFKIGLAENSIQNIKAELQTDQRVQEVIYTSAEKALIDFKEMHQKEDLIIKSINELNENPLPAVLNVKAKDLADYPAIAESLNNPKYSDFISKVSYEDNRSLIDRLSKMLKFIISAGLVLLVIFSLIAILVVYNTITLAIYNRREEVEIMRLVGATNWYIRGPFLVEAALYGIFATFLTGMLFLPVFVKIMPKISLFINPGTEVFKVNVVNYLLILLTMLLLSFILAGISTMLAIRRYLKI